MRSAIICFVLLLAAAGANADPRWRITPDGREMYTKCPQPEYFGSGSFDAKVTHDLERGIYRYLYTFSPSGAKSVPVVRIRVGGKDSSNLFSAISNFKLTRKGAGFGDCNLVPSDTALSCHAAPMGGNKRNREPMELVIESPLPPAPTTFETQSGDFTRETEAEGRAARQAIMQAVPFPSMESYRRWSTHANDEGESCWNEPGATILDSDVTQDDLNEVKPDGSTQAYLPSERGFTGLTLGPSRAVAVEASLVSQAKAQLQVRLLKAKVPVKVLSIKASNSLGHPLKLVSATAVPRLVGGGSDLLLNIALRPADMPCNVKGVLIEGELEDGDALRAGVQVSTPACRPFSREFRVRLPTAEEASAISEANEFSDPP